MEIHFEHRCYSYSHAITMQSIIQHYVLKQNQHNPLFLLKCVRKVFLSTLNTEELLIFLLNLYVADKVQDADKILWEYCGKKLKSKQDLAINRKCVHLVQDIYIDKDSENIEGPSFLQLNEQFQKKEDESDTLYSIIIKAVRAKSTYRMHVKNEGVTQ